MEFVAVCLGRDIVRRAEGEVVLAMVVETQVQLATPVLMCSVPRYGASSRVDDLSAELKKPVTSIAIGSAEEFGEAAVRTDRWVLMLMLMLVLVLVLVLVLMLHAIV